MKGIYRDFIFKGMRKPQSFLIYPCLKDDDVVTLQSCQRIVRVQISKSRAITSKSRSNGSYSPDLDPSRGAYGVMLTPEQVETVKEMRLLMSGETLPDRTVILTVGAL